MSVTSRQKMILNLLDERAFITVKQLSEITYTSESSIRRDLSFLQANGMVQRTHGGVSLRLQIPPGAGDQRRGSEHEAPPLPG